MSHFGVCENCGDRVFRFIFGKDIYEKNALIARSAHSLIEVVNGHVDVACCSMSKYVEILSLR